ncbi:MAG: universal stress protein [Pseudomonadota bacterium]|nr:universal stress protein [Pseudomonadota bacterium]
MYQRILLAFDGSPEGHAVLRQGADLAVLCGAEVCLLAVLTIPSGVAIAESILPPEVEPEARETAQQALRTGAAALRSRGVSIQQRLTTGEPVDQIAAVARDFQADLVVVGHGHRGKLAQWWSGSVGKSLLGHLPCSLLVAIEPEQADPNRINQGY